MAQIYVFARDVTKAECKTLPRDFTAGERVTRGSDQWGLCRDDARMGVETIPCTINDNKFVFTVPAKLLLREDGGKVMGDYWVAGAFDR